MVVLNNPGGGDVNYKDMLQAVDTEKALSLIGIEFQAQGAYAKFACPNCEGLAVIKEYGDKKNLYYCPSCKASGHIISLVMKNRGIEWDAAIEFLNKAHASNAKKITEELKISYELGFSDFIKDKGVSEDMCRFLEIGVPKGKTMLSGSVAFAVRDENGVRIAYYGIKMKDGKPIFHKSFNPELYLYNLCNINKTEPLYLTTDIFKCVGNIENGKQSICNFGLPYLSKTQLDLLRSVEYIVFQVEDIKQFAVQMAENRMNYFRFE